MTRHEPRGHSASLSPTQTESDITARPARSNSQPGTTTGGRYGQDRRHPTGACRITRLSGTSLGSSPTTAGRLLRRRFAHEDADIIPSHMGWWRAWKVLHDGWRNGLRTTNARDMTQMLIGMAAAPVIAMVFSGNWLLWGIVMALLLGVYTWQCWRRPHKHVVDADPVHFRFSVSQPSVTVIRGAKRRRWWQRMRTNTVRVRLRGEAYTNGKK